MVLRPPSPDHLKALLAGPDGALKVFPLGGVVVMPGAPTPFHIFEPRYRAMTADALAGNRILALATLHAPGLPGEVVGAGASRPSTSTQREWTPGARAATPRLDQDLDDPAARPPICAAACAGIIAGEEQLPDGRYHFVFEPLARVRLLAELELGTPYRQFRAEVIDDVLPPRGPSALAGQAEALERCVVQLSGLLPPESGARELAHAVAKLKSPSRLADLVAAAAVSEPAARLRVLGEADVSRRLELVLEELAGVILMLSKGRDPDA